MNELCAKWLLTASRSAGSEPIRHSYRRAARAIQAWKQPITHADDLKAVKGVGPFILSFLKTKLEGEAVSTPAANVVSRNTSLPAPPAKHSAPSSASSPIVLCDDSDDDNDSDGIAVVVNDEEPSRSYLSTHVDSHFGSTASADNDDEDDLPPCLGMSTASPTVPATPPSSRVTPRERTPSRFVVARGSVSVPSRSHTAGSVSTPEHTAHASRIARTFSSGSGSATTGGMSSKVASSPVSTRRPTTAAGPANDYDFPLSPPRSTGKRRPPKAKTPAKKSRTSGPRLPAQGSGAYGIFMAFLKARESDEFAARGSYLLKKELQSAAQPFCNTSYTRAEGNTGYYTAWSCVSQMVRKGWVAKYSNPAKYTLTGAGWDIAETLQQREGEQHQSITPTPTSPHVTAALPPSPPSPMGTLPPTNSTRGRGRKGSSSNSNASQVGRRGRKRRSEPTSAATTAAAATTAVTATAATTAARPVNTSPSVQQSATSWGTTLAAKGAAIAARGGRKQPAKCTPASVAIELLSSMGMAASIPSSFTTARASAPNTAPSAAASAATSSATTETAPTATTVTATTSRTVTATTPRTPSSATATAAAPASRGSSSASASLSSSFSTHRRSSHRQQQRQQQPAAAGTRAPEAETLVILDDDDDDNNDDGNGSSGFGLGGGAAFDDSWYDDGHGGSGLRPMLYGGAFDAGEDGDGDGRGVAVPMDVKQERDDDWTTAEQHRRNDNSRAQPPKHTSAAKHNTLPHTPTGTATAASAARESIGAAMAQRATRDYTMAPDTYEVVLLIDNRENQVRKKDRGAIMHSSLAEQGIQCEVRQLPLGDYSWILKEKPEHAAMHGRRQREVCLSFLVERKRFDDFAQSIMYRGRLSSQLHRFYSMEVSHPVLLVEEGQLHVPGIDEARLKQATFNIQVEGGFFVKTVPNIREVEAYLVLCTRMIKQLVQGCSVEAWTPTERMCCHLRGFAGWGQPKDGHVHSFDFQTFQEISRRAATGTIREVFAHQLLHMNGLTLKHAQMITQAYPTPALFTNALREAHAATMHMSSLEDRKPNSSSARGGDNSTVFSPSSASATAAPATTTAAATTPTAASPSTLASGLKRRSSSAKTKTALDAFWDSLSTSEGKIGLAVRAKLQAYYLPRS